MIFVREANAAIVLVTLTLSLQSDSPVDLAVVERKLLRFGGKD